MSSMIFDSLGHLGTLFSAEVLQTILKEFGILEDILAIVLAFQN